MGWRLLELWRARSSARFPAAATLALALLSAVTATAGAGAEQPPPRGPFDAPGTVWHLRLFNDSLNLGIGVVAAPLGQGDMDGNDEGFTHGSELGVERVGADGTTHCVELASRLYLRRQLPRSAGDPRRDVPVWFTEEERLSYVADTRRRGRRTFFELGAGAIVAGKTATTLGAAGQQRWFHDHVNRDNQTTYRFEDDGRGTWGVFVRGGCGLQGALALGGGGGAVAGMARVAAEPSTLGDASRFVAGAAAALSHATGRRRIAATVAVDAALHPGGLRVDPSVEVAYERRRWGVRSAVSFPLGEPLRHLRYDDDRDPITTLAVFVRFPR